MLDERNLCYEKTFDLIRAAIALVFCSCYLWNALLRLIACADKGPPPPFNLHRGPPFPKATTDYYL